MMNEACKEHSMAYMAFWKSAAESNDISRMTMTLNSASMSLHTQAVNT